MEAKEFMLGDLVYRKEHNEFRKPVPRSVVKIDGVENNDMITIAPDSEFLNMDEIEPIPWTAEIAVKNGFEFEGGEYWLRCGALTIRTGNGYVAIVETFKNGVTQERVNIRQICFHELQHALRLEKTSLMKSLTHCRTMHIYAELLTLTICRELSIWR